MSTVLIGLLALRDCYDGYIEQDKAVAIIIGFAVCDIVTVLLTRALLS